MGIGVYELVKAGSSPRTWGTVAEDVGADIQRRFIPTHVGNRSHGSREFQIPTVHPHARGEQKTWPKRNSINTGSSPRTWGTGHLCLGVGLCGRFIPTHVGNSPAHTPARRGASVHPHARGEQAEGGEFMSVRAGSSPRTWGTGSLIVGRRYTTRFIPTHVGNRCWVRLIIMAVPVHPHARGEQISFS